jgi:hypothetical protein
MRLDGSASHDIPDEVMSMRESAAASTISQNVAAASEGVSGKPPPHGNGHRKISKRALSKSQAGCGIRRFV